MVDILKNMLYKHSEKFFLIAWVLMLINTSVYYSNIENLDLSILSAIALCFFSLKIISTIYSTKELIFNVFLLIFGVITYIYSKELRIFWLTVVIVSSKNIDIYKIARYTLLTIFVLVCFYIILFVFGFTSETVTNKGGRSFGLGHPNSAHFYLMLILSLIVFLNFNNLEIYHYIIFMFLNILVYYFTKSRSGFLTLFILLFYPLFLRLVKNEKLKKYINNVYIFIAIAIITFFTIIPLIYDNEILIFQSINQLLTGRIMQANFYFKNFGLSFFGTFLSYLSDPNTTAILDIGYIKLLINNGLFSYLFIIISYLLCLKKYYNKNEYQIIFLLLVPLVHMATENTMTYVFMNMSMLLFANIYFMKEE